MSFPNRIAVAALLGSLAAAFGAPLLLPLDAAVHRAVQDARTCGLAEAIPAIDLVVRVVFAGVFGGFVLGYRREALSLLAVLALVALAGGVVGEVLKTAFERMRPNEAPGDVSGNAFPSGHIMNTTLAAVALSMLAARLGCGRGMVALVAGLGGFGVLAQVAYRLLNGSHWASDAIVSILLGVAWMLGGESFVRRASWRALGAGAVLVTIAFGVFYEIPSIRIRVPSALDRTSEPVASLELGNEAAGLEGSWAHGWREPVGGVSWAMDREVSIRLRSGGPGRLLRLTLRPPARFEDAQGCVRVRVWIESRPREITLLEGWREYHFALPPPEEEGWRQVRLEILADHGSTRGNAPGLLAVHDVRVD